MDQSSLQRQAHHLATVLKLADELVLGIIYSTSIPHRILYGAGCCLAVYNRRQLLYVSEPMMYRLALAPNAYTQKVLQLQRFPEIEFYSGRPSLSLHQLGRYLQRIVQGVQAHNSGVPVQLLGLRIHNFLKEIRAEELKARIPVICLNELWLRKCLNLSDDVDLVPYYGIRGWSFKDMLMAFGYDMTQLRLCDPCVRLQLMLELFPRVRAYDHFHRSSR